MKNLAKIKKETEVKILELRHERKNIISNFKKKAEEVKISQIKNSILNK